MHQWRVALGCMALVLILALLIPLVGCGGGEPAPCKVASVSGDVQVLRSSLTESVKATRGMELTVGDTITTGDNGSANLVFFDGSVMEVKAKSEILVKELKTASTDSTSIRLRQNIGRTINRVKKLVDPASKYEVETPAAVVVVRGTVFDLLVLQSGDTTVKAEEGSVLFTASGITVTVNQGFRSSASVGGTPSTPTPTLTPTATATTVETTASTPPISSTLTATVTPAKTPASTSTPTSTQPTPNSAMPQGLIGVWKSDCVAGTEQNQYMTYTATITGTSVQVIEDQFMSDSSCTDPSIYFRFMNTSVVYQVSQNADDSYEITVTLTQMSATALKQEYISWYNSNNLWGYSDWQVGISKDCLGRTALSGYSPAPTMGSQHKAFMKVDGDKLTVNDLAGITEYTRQK